MMIVLALLAAFLFFSPFAAARPVVLAAVRGGDRAGAVFSISLAEFWLASFVAGLYLLWFWRKPFVLIVPAALALAVWFGPGSVRARFDSILHPSGELDSNLHRLVTWRTGLRMVQAHPWFGLGPEVVNLKFKDYLPPDAPKPLPSGLVRPSPQHLPAIRGRARRAHAAGPAVADG